MSFPKLTRQNLMTFAFYLSESFTIDIRYIINVQHIMAEFEFCVSGPSLPTRNFLPGPQAGQ